ncbi:MAG: 30S ribosomal protein S13, partial [Actinobacteria bacterium]|nr:30S ribosomal protein S13 [Actinomycetota bacterium]
MVRISGVDIPNDKHICIALTYIFGIGRSAAEAMLDKLNINKSIKAKDLSEDELVKIREYIEKNYTIEGDLRREVSQNIKRLI